MEPQPGTGIIKLVNEFAGYTHNVECRPFPSPTTKVMSVPRSHAENPTDTFPTECELAIYKLIDTCLPHLSGRPLINRAMCWCTDTVDSQWLICEHPRYKNLILATGDSGHTFKMFPVVGKQVADLVEGKVSQGWRKSRLTVIATKGAIRLVAVAS
jgi:sarcosine oxidase/sarcosine oxidase/L-pipecolate oxidase